jgi:flavin reductase
MSEQLHDAFRRAMRALASTVTIISTESGGRRFGMTATAVTSLSMAPPSLLACINVTASIHPHLLDAASFCVNILHGSQIDVAEAFSTRKSEDRFSIGAWMRDDYSIPYLAEAQANIFCRTEATYVHGTHRIFIGNVQDVRVRDRINPLLYQNGRYTVGHDEGVDWIIPIA